MQFCCLYLRCFIPLLFISQLICSHICNDGTEHCFCSSAFILHPIEPLACPILFCSALSVFPFHWCRLSFPPLSLSLLQHSSDLCLPCWTRSDTGRGETKIRRQEYQTVSCCYCQNIAFFSFSASFVQSSWVLVKDGRARSQTQR